MQLMIYQHPAGHITGHGLTSVSSYTFAALWDIEFKRRNFAFMGGDDLDVATRHVACRSAGYTEIGTYEVIDEREDAMRNSIGALYYAFDARRDIATRDTSRYLAAFRKLLNEMLRFYDNPAGFLPELPPTGALPEITLLVGARQASRYDFWEVRR